MCFLFYPRYDFGGAREVGMQEPAGFLIKKGREVKLL
jgi:hypothetical protein